MCWTLLSVLQLYTAPKCPVYICCVTLIILGYIFYYHVLDDAVSVATAHCAYVFVYYIHFASQQLTMLSVLQLHCA